MFAISSRLGIRDHVSGLKAKLINLCFRRGAVQPLKSMVAGRAIKPKTCFKLGSNCNSNATERQPTCLPERASSRARFCMYSNVSFITRPLLWLSRNVHLVSAGGEIALGLSPLRSEDKQSLN